MNPAQRLSLEEELARYQEHQNDPDDADYQQFLSKLANPLLERLEMQGNPNGLDGLDYGCGPGPALAQMLIRAGHRVSLFDPFFFPARNVLDKQYDFITCTETVEHFFNPAEEFARFQQMLRPGGWLAVMTCFQTDDTRFASWYYRRDPTHVVFFRKETLNCLAASFGWTCEIPVKDVALFQKPVFLHTS